LITINHSRHCAACASNFCVQWMLVQWCWLHWQ